MGKITKSFVSYYEANRGPVYAQMHYKKSIARGRSIKLGLQEVKKKWPNIDVLSEHKPIFIFSAGWRSGSTLMQRLVMSKESVLIWGEPYSHARMLWHLSASISAITDDWPETDWFVDQHDLNKLNTTFVANLYPEIQEMKKACLAYIETLLEQPAKERGFKRWGLKDVRLTIDDAFFLKWLFPNGKFIFLTRNPYDAYRSYRLTRSWYNEWPDDPVFTAKRFGRHWRLLADGYLKDVAEIGGILVRYEDLCAGKVDIVELENYLELEIDPMLLNKKVGSHRHDDDGVPKYELKMLKNEVSVVAKKLGYENLTPIKRSEEKCF